MGEQGEVGAGEVKSGISEWMELIQEPPGEKEPSSLSFTPLGVF